MWNALTPIIVMAVVTILRAVLKNPAQAAKEGAIISEIAAAATEADQAVNGTVWTSTPGPKPAA